MPKVEGSWHEQFAEELKGLFLELMPSYIGKAHEKIGTKIKPEDGTPVTDLDHHTLERLRALIAAGFPADYTIGEEDKNSPEEIRKILESTDDHQWTIDGLDGTGNLRAGLNSYGAMVARRHGDQILFAALFTPIDMKLRGNGFRYAVRGGGTWEWCEGHQEYHRLSAASEGELDRMVVLLEGSSKKFFKPPISNLGATVTTRPGFSSCIAATAVARGNVSALVTTENKPWDTWPAILLIEEAGGTVTCHDGSPWSVTDCGSIIAAGNKRDHSRILEILNTE